MAKKAKTPTTKAPKGLKITRNGSKFTFSWTNGETYFDVDLLVWVNGKPKGGMKIKAGAADLAKNSFSMTFPYKYGKTKYDPKTSVSFRVRGQAWNNKKKKTKKKESAYAAAVTYKILDPSNPSILAEWQSDVDNRTRFLWSIANTDAANTRWYLGHTWRTWYQYQNDKPVYSGWSKRSDAAYSYTPSESATLSAPLKRVVEVYSRGKKKNSGIFSAYHVYAKPLQPYDPTINSVSDTAHGIDIYTTWTNRADAWHPIDNVEVHYAISPPAYGMAAPKNLSGTTISTRTPPAMYGNSTSGDTHTIASNLDDNQCLFVRVRTKHDNEENYSNWVRAAALKSQLSRPTGLTLGTNFTDNIIRVTATNTAEDEVADSFLAVYYLTRTSDGTESPRKTIGIMPNKYPGTSSLGYVDVRIPDDPNALPATVKFGVQAIAYPLTDYHVITIDGETTKQKNYVFSILKEDLYVKSGNNYRKLDSGDDYSSTQTYYAKFKITTGIVGNKTITYQSETMPCRYKEYSIDTTKIAMQSEEAWEAGEFPKPPENFNVVSTSSEVATATWDWSWSQATQIELAWSEYSDAWESTEEPQTYRVPVNRATSWNIRGLTAGTTWYIRARFIVESGETETEGPWSTIIPLNLTSAPVAPALTLSRNVVTENQDFIASWTYTSTDGTPQALAEIFLVTVDEYGIRRGSYKPAIDCLPQDESGDPIFDQDSTYYTYNSESGVYSKVSDPIESDIGNYYMFDDASALIQTDKNSTVQQLTLNTSLLPGLALGQTYHLSLRLTSTSSAVSEWSPMVDLTIVEPLEPPVITGSTELIPETVTNTVKGTTYSKTTDSTVQSNKDYYTVTGVEVVAPAENELEFYYELNNDIYSLTTDTTLNSSKTYYTVSGESVLEPSSDDISTYYELDSTTSSTTYLALKQLPLNLTITGAGENGTTMVSIERATEFFTSKPDDSTDTGYEGEVVALIHQQGEAPITITQEDLMGYLDDTATYKIVASITDTNGQTASEEYVKAPVTAENYASYKPILFTRTDEKPYIYSSLVDSDAAFDANTVYYYKNEFTVSWSHQPVQPEAEVEVDTERLAVKIKPVIPEGYTPAAGDVIDIYRLSVDKPQLIVSNGVIGETYVDPYPAFGEFGGHRVVYKTVNGDYIAEDIETGQKIFSWIDLDEEEGDTVESDHAVIDFDDDSVDLYYNIELSSSWSKDFKETRYLGGHIQGDWTPGVSRTGSMSTVTVITQDQDTIKAMRRLADYAGIAHVRTRDGSSYSADVQVSESMSYSSFELANYSLSFTRVDSEAYDGMTLAEWNKKIQNEEVEE